MTKDFKVSGFLPVFSITDDFWTVAENEKRDSEIPDWLRDRGRPGDVELARDAEAGMKLMKRSKALRSARGEEFTELKDRIRELHSKAFGWEAPPARERETLASRSIREHVKLWIAEWDMMLLYPDYRPDIVVDQVVTDYSEDSDLSREELETAEQVE